LIKKVLKKTGIYKFFNTRLTDLDEKVNRNIDDSNKILMKLDELSISIIANKEKLQFQEEYIKDINLKLQDICSSCTSIISDVNSQFYNIDQKLESLNTETINKFNLINDKFNLINNKFNLINDKLNLLQKRTEQFEYINTELLFLMDRDNNKKQVLIVGFYGADNLGDELMLQAILENLKIYDNIQITVMIADNTKYNLSDYGNIKFIHYPKTHADINIIANYFDKIIFGGGALIDDKEYDNQDVKNTNVANILVDLSVNAINKGKDVFLIGMSTSNEFDNKCYLEKLNQIAQKAKVFYLRDSNSLETLKKYNIDCSNIKIMEDLAYALPNYKLSYPEKEFSIGMVLVSYTDEKILLSILEETEKFLKENVSDNYIKKIKLIPFYDYQNSDIKRYKEIIDKYSKNSNIEIEILNYTSNYIQLSKNFMSLRMIICMRYHSSLLALKMGIPAIHIIYDVHRHYINKMNYLKKVYNIEDYCISLKDFDNDDLLIKLNNLLNEYEDKKKRIQMISIDKEKMCRDSIKDIIKKL